MAWGGKSIGEEALRAIGAVEELMWPTRCVGCNMPGALLCDDCRARLPWIAQRWACPVCGAPFGWLVCTECDRSRDVDSLGGDSLPERRPTPQDLERLLEEHVHRRWPCRATICALSFQDTAAKLVTALKDAHELRVAPVMAAAMACALDEAAAWPALDGAPRYDRDHADILSFVPATAEAFARRGFDHMEHVARPLARELGIPLADVLVRSEARDQRALGKEARAENLAGTVSVIDDVRGLDVLLVDDVVTTGSSMAESARALMARGSRSVTACAFTRVW